MYRNVGIVIPTNCRWLQCCSRKQKPQMNIDNAMVETFAVVEPIQS
jgi:hypothetical protein